MDINQLEHDFSVFVAEHDGKLSHQMADVPYSVGVFRLGGKIYTLTLMEDAEGYYA